MSKLDEMYTALAPAKKDGYPVTQIAYDELQSALAAAKERIRELQGANSTSLGIIVEYGNKIDAANERIRELEAALTETHDAWTSRTEELFAEREVSYKLRQALIYHGEEAAKLVDDIERNRAAIAELVVALKGVVLVADRQTDEFDAARSAITKYDTPTTTKKGSN